MGFIKSFTDILGLPGIMVVVFMMVFIFCYRYAQVLFAAIENHTAGTRNYILDRLKILFIEIKPQYITYTLLSLSFGSGLTVFLACGLVGRWSFGIFFGIVFCILGWKIPRPLVDYLVRKRIKAYQGQMVDGLTLLSNGIRAGPSVPQALG
ncbi:MAG: hypothetical protein WCG27_06075, partial [Pseudomonadota bacterium]